jgi:hypothetical protein
MKGSPAAPVATEVVVARAVADFRVHLAAEGGQTSLCGQVRRARPPHLSFRDAGCRECLTAARDTGIVAAREGDRSWINLLRL